MTIGNLFWPLIFVSHLPLQYKKKKKNRRWLTWVFPSSHCHSVNQNGFHLPIFLFYFQELRGSLALPLSIFWISWKAHQIRKKFTFAVFLAAKCCIFSNHDRYFWRNHIIFETDFRKWIKKHDSQTELFESEDSLGISVV